jgi:hypothetical protein
VSSALRSGVLSLLASTAIAAPIQAHEGPPYEIAHKESLAGRSLSIWADPDVGVGIFYFYFEDELPVGSTSIRVGVRPVDGRLEEASFDAVPGGPKDAYQLVVEVPFDQRGLWNSRFAVSGEGGAEEVVIEVDVTPPGGTGWDLVYYISPFVALAVFWVKVVMKKRELSRATTPCEPNSTDPSASS